MKKKLPIIQEKSIKPQKKKDQENLQFSTCIIVFCSCILPKKTYQPIHEKQLINLERPNYDSFMLGSQLSFPGQFFFLNGRCKLFLV